MQLTVKFHWKNCRAHRSFFNVKYCKFSIYIRYGKTILKTFHSKRNFYGTNYPGYNSFLFSVKLAIERDTPLADRRLREPFLFLKITHSGRQNPATAFIIRIRLSYLTRNELIDIKRKRRVVVI